MLTDDTCVDFKMMEKSVVQGETFKIPGEKDSPAGAMLEARLAKLKLLTSVSCILVEKVFL